MAQRIGAFISDVVYPQPAARPDRPTPSLFDFGPEASALSGQVRDLSLYCLLAGLSTYVMFESVETSVFAAVATAAVTIIVWTHEPIPSQPPHKPQGDLHEQRVCELQGRARHRKFVVTADDPAGSCRQVIDEIDQIERDMKGTEADPRLYQVGVRLREARRQAELDRVRHTLLKEGSVVETPKNPLSLYVALALHEAPDLTGQALADRTAELQAQIAPPLPPPRREEDKYLVPHEAELAKCAQVLGCHIGVYQFCDEELRPQADYYGPKGRSPAPPPRTPCRYVWFREERGRAHYYMVRPRQDREIDPVDRSS